MGRNGSRCRKHGKLVNIQHYDQLGRIRLSRQLEDATSQSETDETTGIKVQTRYRIDGVNAYQLVSNPYRAATSGAATRESTMGWTRTKLDNAGRVVEVKFFSGVSLPAPWGSNASTTGAVSTTYDGIYTTVKDQAGKLRRTKNDGLGRLVRVDEPDANNNLGDPMAPADPETNTNPGADPSETNAESILGTTTAPQQQTEYTYDALSNLIQVKQGVQTRTYDYSSLSRLTAARNPENGTVQYTYDADGNIQTKRDERPVTITYEYDLLNRVKTRRYSNNSAPAVDYLYDGEGLTNTTNFKGRLTRIVTQGVSTTNYNAYDALGRVLQSSQTTDGQTYTMSYGYNLAGHMVFQEYPSHNTVTTSYDAAGRISGVSGPSDQPPYLGSLRYTAHGAIEAMQLGNRLWQHLKYNSRLQPTQIGLGTSSTNSTVLQLDYKYGALVNGTFDAKQNNGNMQSQTITIPASGTEAGLTLTQSYSYDQLNRLSSFTETGGLSQTYKYNQFGNRAVTAGYVEDVSLTPRSVSAYNTTTNQVAAWSGVHPKSETTS